MELVAGCAERGCDGSVPIAAFGGTWGIVIPFGPTNAGAPAVRGAPGVPWVGNTACFLAIAGGSATFKDAATTPAPTAAAPICPAVNDEPGFGLGPAGLTTV